MKLILLTLVIGLAVGCKGGSGGSSNPGDAIAPTDARAALVEDTYIGLWGACFNDTSDNTSYLDVKNFSSDSLISSYAYYTGLNCQSANLLSEEKYVFNIVRNGTTYTSSLQGASIRPMKASDVTGNNSQSYCGYTNWVLNTPKDALNKNCGGDTSNVGSGGNFTITKNGTQLVMVAEGDTITLNPLIVPGFGHAGTALTSGNYVFYSDNVATMINLNSGSYVIFKIHALNGIRYAQYGTYTTSGDNVTFTMTSETPSCGTVGDTVTVKYTPSALGMIFKDVDNNLATAESFDWNSIQFMNAFVGVGTTNGCL